jgi:hypothetical protein
MIDLCTAAGLQPPEFRQDEGHFVQTLWRPAVPSTTQATQQATTQDKPLLSIALEELAVALGQPTTQVTTQVAEQVGKLLRAAAEPATREHLQDAVGLQNREHFRQTYLEPLLTAGWMERTIPDKPTSRHQRYPMGALHRLVDLLRKLDPENTRWVARQRARLVAERQRIDVQPDRELRKELLADHARHEVELAPLFDPAAGSFDRDYARKVFLIQNSIFGVDLQPIAVQITKLRFFIALIRVEQPCRC